MKINKKNNCKYIAFYGLKNMNNNSVIPKIYIRIRSAIELLKKTRDYGLFFKKSNNVRHTATQNIK